jgi:hypothetical protein
MAVMDTKTVGGGGGGALRSGVDQPEGAGAGGGTPTRVTTGRALVIGTYMSTSPPSQATTRPGMRAVPCARDNTIE